MGQTDNVFVSHLHEDDSRIADLRTLLADRGMTVRDSSVTVAKPSRAEDPDDIKVAEKIGAADRLEDRIAIPVDDRVGVVLEPSGMSAFVRWIEGFAERGLQGRPGQWPAT